jgi:uncharacterized membrane protein
MSNIPNIQEILFALQLISLIVITGGTITIGALTAPSIFGNLSRQEAGAVMIDLFSRFDRWIKFSAITLLIAKFFEFVIVYKSSFYIINNAEESIIKTFNTSLFSSSILVVGIGIVSLVLAFKLSPRMIDSYENDLPNFERLHQQSEMLHKANFALGLALLLSFASI